MCRVLFAVGSGSEMVPLVRALVKASEKDLYKEARGREGQHRSGWGYILLKRDTLMHYRSIRPIFKDPMGVNSLIGSLDGFAVLMVHTRAASQGKKNLLNTQPFAFSSARGFSCWIYHNGDLDKRKILQLAGFDEAPLKNASDSYVMGLYLCGNIESPGREELLKRYSTILTAVNTSLNTGAVFISADGKVKGFVTAYSKPTYLLKRENWDYARQISISREDLFAVGSSTLELYHSADWKPLRNGTALYVDVSMEDESLRVEELVLG